MTTLNFLEECKKLGKKGKVAMLEAGKEGERCGASRWYSFLHKHRCSTDLTLSCRTMAYLRLDKDNKFDKDWGKEMALVSEGMAGT